MRVEGEPVDATETTLDGGETASLGFEIPAANRSAGTYNYSVDTPEDRATGTLVVEAASGGDETDGGRNDTGGGAAPTETQDPVDGTPEATEAPSKPEDGDDGGPFGLPVPIAGRHAVGGAVLVGGTYVLDYVRESPAAVQQGVTTVRALFGQLLD